MWHQDVWPGKCTGSVETLKQTDVRKSETKMTASFLKTGSKHIKDSKERLFIMTQTHKLDEVEGDYPENLYIVLLLFIAFI